jgi:hypothetical protein
MLEGTARRFRVLDDVTHTGRRHTTFADQLHRAVHHPLARRSLLICHTTDPIS